MPGQVLIGREAVTAAGRVSSWAPGDVLIVTTLAGLETEAYCCSCPTRVLISRTSAMRSSLMSIARRYSRVRFRVRRPSLHITTCKRVGAKMNLSAPLKHAEALAVFSLPVGAFNLHPRLAWAADVGPVEALGHDALEAKLGAVLEKELAVDLRSLPLSKRKRDLDRLCRKGRVPLMRQVQTFPILVEEIERHEHEPRLAGPPGAHLGVQLSEIGAARGVDHAELAVEHRGARWQGGECRAHVWQAVGLYSAPLLE
jgi:hypothetical protein